MNFKMRHVQERLEDLIEKFQKEAFGKCRKVKGLISNCQSTVEEKLYCLLLASFFDSLETARDFYQKLNWAGLLRSDQDQILEICKNFFIHMRHIGDHRRNLGRSSGERRAIYTAEMLWSYKNVMAAYDSQARFFEVNGSPEFDLLYQRMAQIAHFDTRLPRFDHLERVSRAFDFYTVPDRFYSEEGRKSGSGPLGGLTYLVLGQRYHKLTNQEKKSFEADLCQDFPALWNASVDNETYKIGQGANFEEIIRVLEKWVIEKVWKLLPHYQRDDKTFVFELESCICNWQKEK